MECFKENEEYYCFYHGYLVSNKGRILNKRFDEIKGYLHRSNGYAYRNIVLRENGKRISKQLNQIVAECFCPFWKNDIKFYIYHKDGNKNNCAYDNLFICKAYTEKPSAEQLKIYEESIFKCVQHIFGKQGYMFAEYDKGIDIDNVMSNVYMQVFKYLPGYKVGTSFYKFVKKYADWEFKRAYKQYKIDQEILKEFKDKAEQEEKENGNETN